jgi:hypothetical protein
MNKIVPLIGMLVATLFAGRAAMQFSDLPITKSATAETSGIQPAEARPTVSPEAQTTRGDSSRGEPAYKAVIRLLNDLDELLDTISSPATFQAIKPVMLGRVRQHVAQASDHPQGMAKLSRAASQEMQQAMNRHAASLTRANAVAPEVTRFFEREVAAVLKPK